MWGDELLTNGVKAGSGNVLTALADLFLPRLCCVCGEELGRNERHICLGCLAGMPLTLNWIIRRNPMAERFNALIAGKSLSDEPAPLSDEPVPVQEQAAPLSDESVPVQEQAEPSDNILLCYSRYVYAVALFDFVKDGGYRNITYRLKYSGDISEGRFFASMLGKRAASAEWFSDVDTVIPVPLHWTRRLRRGYNQAEIIAAELASALGARLRTDVLVRNRRTSTQTRLDIEGKASNVSGAFSINPKFRRHSARHNGVHILLVDDVFTTGATLYNCWKPLHDFFGPSVRISIATLGIV